MGHALHYAPQQISTEPLEEAPSDQGQVITSHAYAALQETLPRLRPNPVVPPPPPSPNQRPIPQGFMNATQRLPGESFPVAPTQVQEVTATHEQLKNDVFAIATNVSALSDRLNRLEDQLRSQSGNTQGAVEALRGEIRSWLENHLHAAVEHCMQHFLSRQSLSQNPPSR